MKVKIIASNPPKNVSDITKYIGKIFDAYTYRGDVYIFLEDDEDLQVYDDEYEIVEP